MWKCNFWPSGLELNQWPHKSSAVLCQLSYWWCYCMVINSVYIFIVAKPVRKEADPAKHLTGAHHMGGIACVKCAYMLGGSIVCPLGKFWKFKWLKNAILCIFWALWIYPEWSSFQTFFMIFFSHQVLRIHNLQI